MSGLNLKLFIHNLHPYPLHHQGSTADAVYFLGSSHGIAHYIISKLTVSNFSAGP